MAVMNKNYLFGGQSRRWMPIVYLLPGILLYFVIAIGPSMATTVYSFTNETGIQGAQTDFIGLANYSEFTGIERVDGEWRFNDVIARDNLGATWRTLQFSFFVTFIQFTLGPLSRASCGSSSSYPVPGPWPRSWSSSGHRPLSSPATPALRSHG
jgi:ABC-type sugar transport system permease subunit